MKLLIFLLLCALAVAVAAPCSKPSKADILWLVDSTTFASNELHAVADLIQAVGEDLRLGPDGIRMGYVDAAARLKVDLVDVVDYGKQIPKMRNASAALDAVENEIFAKTRPDITRIIILFPPDARVEARSLKNNNDVLILLLHVGRAAPLPDFADFVIHAADFNELATMQFQSSFLCLDLVPHSNPTLLHARSLAVAPNRRLAAGQNFFNCIQDNGEVYSWGRSYGLGSGNSFDSAFPIRMLGVSAASDVSANMAHTCVVDGGAAKCTGWGDFGQLGNSANDDSFTVVQVQGLSTGVAKITAGAFHTCAILETGGMRCWGKGFSGQLGNGTNTNSNTPMSVINYTSSGVHSASAGNDHTCIVTTAGAALCTGAGGQGQLGNGDAANQNILTQVTNLTSGVAQISCGGTYTCALLGTGAVACFGKDNYGQLGMGNDLLTNYYMPVFPSSLNSSIATLAVGWRAACVIDNSTRAARCFGMQAYSQFANPSAAGNQFLPVPFGGGITGIMEIAIGYDAICMLDGLGSVQCAGDDTYFQMGGGNSDPSPRGFLDYVIGLPATSAPSTSPSISSSASPSIAPSASPSISPSASPSIAPSTSPSPSPSTSPTASPSASPSLSPSSSPSKGPSSSPSSSPSTFPSSSPSASPSLSPSAFPSSSPSASPSLTPSANPSASPSIGPSTSPSLMPSTSPSTSPSLGPSVSPSSSPSTSPTVTTLSPTLPSTMCEPQTGMSKSQCTKRAKSCKTEGMPMRWTGLGCKIQGKRMLDGGCQCANYCGFTCKSSCNAAPNRAYCKWEDGVCIAKATGLPGSAVPRCPSV